MKNGRPSATVKQERKCHSRIGATIPHAVRAQCMAESYNCVTGIIREILLEIPININEENKLPEHVLVEIYGEKHKAYSLYKDPSGKCEFLWTAKGVIETEVSDNKHGPNLIFTKFLEFNNIDNAKATLMLRCSSQCDNDCHEDTIDFPTLICICNSLITDKASLFGIHESQICAWKKKSKLCMKLFENNYQ